MFIRVHITVTVRRVSVTMEGVSSLIKFHWEQIVENHGYLMGRFHFFWCQDALLFFLLLIFCIISAVWRENGYDEREERRSGLCQGFELSLRRSTQRKLLRKASRERNSNDSSVTVYIKKGLPLSLIALCSFISLSQFAGCPSKVIDL